MGQRISSLRAASSTQQTSFGGFKPLKVQSPEDTFAKVKRLQKAGLGTPEPAATLPTPFQVGDSVFDGHGSVRKIAALGRHGKVRFEGDKKARGQLKSLHRCVPSFGAFKVGDTVYEANNYSPRIIEHLGEHGEVRFSSYRTSNVKYLTREVNEIDGFKAGDEALSVSASYYGTVLTPYTVKKVFADGSAHVTPGRVSADGLVPVAAGNDQRVIKTKDMRRPVSTYGAYSVGDAVLDAEGLVGPVTHLTDDGLCRYKVPEELTTNRNSWNQSVRSTEVTKLSKCVSEYKGLRAGGKGLDSQGVLWDILQVTADGKVRAASLDPTLGIWRTLVLKDPELKPVMVIYADAV